jgi:hypothetical protein
MKEQVAEIVAAWQAETLTNVSGVTHGRCSLRRLMAGSLSRTLPIPNWSALALGTGIIEASQRSRAFLAPCAAPAIGRLFRHALPSVKLGRFRCCWIVAKRNQMRLLLMGASQVQSKKNPPAAHDQSDGLRRPIFDAECQRFADAARQLIELCHSRGNGVEARGPVTDGRSRETYLDRIYREAGETFVPDHDVHLGMSPRARQFPRLDNNHFPTIFGRSPGCCEGR